MEPEAVADQSCPVPPYWVAIAVPFQVPTLIFPSVVILNIASDVVPMVKTPAIVVVLKPAYPEALIVISVLPFLPASTLISLELVTK